MTAWAETSLYKRILARHGDLEQIREQWGPQREDIVRNFRPDVPVEVDDEGHFLNSDMYTGDPVHAALTMARGFTGTMVGRQLNWIRYFMSHIAFRGNDLANKYMQELEDHMTPVYARSNFYGKMPEFVLGGVTIGSPVMLTQEDRKNNRNVLTIPHYKEVYLGQNYFGEDTIFHRKYEMKAKDANDQFGKEALSRSVNNSLKQGEFFTKSEYIHAIYEKDDPIFADLMESDKKFAPKRPWVEFYIEKSTDLTKQFPLPTPKDAGPGYFSKPFTAWHYHKNSTESYARTPAWFAIFDAKGGQQNKKALIIDAELKVRPATWSMPNRRGKLYLGPGAKNYADSAQDFDRQPQIMYEGGKYSVGVDSLDRFWADVERFFHTKLFTQLAQLVDSKQAPPTATQVRGMFGEKAILLSAGIQSYESEVLTPINERFMEIEDRAGRLPQPNDELVEMAAEIAAAEGPGTFAADIDAEFLGILSRAQRESKISSRLVAYDAIAQLAQFDPNLPKKFRISLSAERIAEELALPQDEIVPEDEYQERLKEDAQRQAIEQQLLAAESAAGTAEKLGKPVDETSVLASVS